jgi:hypothetical protein
LVKNKLVIGITTVELWQYLLNYFNRS